MSPEQAKHLRIGTLVAMSEAADKAENGFSEHEHFDSCDECSMLYKFLVKHGEAAKKDTQVSFEKGVTCPKSDMDELAFFLTFFKNGLPEEQAARFLSHLNECYFCFEIFITNWSAYLQGGKNEKSKKTQKEEEGTI